MDTQTSTEITVQTSRFTKANYLNNTTPKAAYFIAAKQRYDTTILQTPAEETAALLRLLHGLDQISIPDLIDDEALSTLITQRIRSLDEYIPKILHFICLGELETITVDYIQIWAEYNPSYEIRIWTHHNTSLLHELSQAVYNKAREKIQDQSEQTTTIFDQALIQAIWEEQNSVYKKMKKSLTTLPAVPQNFNTVALDLLTQLIAGSQRIDWAMKGTTHFTSFTTGINRLKSAGYINIKIHDLALFPAIEDADSPSPNRFTAYIKHLCFGNQSLAKEIARLAILKENGGLYIGEGLLPELNKLLFATIFKQYSSKYSFDSIEQIIIQAILNWRTKANPSKMPGRKALLVSREEIGYINLLNNLPTSMLQSIQQIISQDAGSNPLFLPLNNQKADACFGCKYSENACLLAAKKDSAYIEQRIKDLETLQTIIDNPAYHIQGLTKTPIQRPSPELQNILSSKNIWVPAYHLLHYRYDTMIGNNDVTTQSLAGINAYEQSKSNYLKSIDIDVLDNTNKTTAKYLDQANIGFKQATFATEEALLADARRPFAIKDRNLFTRQSKYNAQLVLQLDQDGIAHRVANALYNKDIDTSAWYQYLGTEQAGRLQKHFPTDSSFLFQGNKRISLVKHGQKMQTINAQNVVQLLTQANLVKSGDTIERLSLISCNLAEFDSENVIAGKLKTGIIKNLFTAFKESGIQIKTITARENNMTVDITGRRWIREEFTNIMGEKTITYSWGKESMKKYLYTPNLDGTINYRLINLEADALARVTQGVFTAKYNRSNSYQYTFTKKQVDKAQKKLPQTEKLKGWIHKDIVSQMLLAYQKGPVLVNAEAITLLVGMQKSPFEIVVNDTNIYKHLHLYNALEKTLTINDWSYWIDSIDFEEGKRNNYLIKQCMQNSKLFPDGPQKAFETLKNKVRMGGFGINKFDLTNASSAANIRKSIGNQKFLQAAYLGDINDYVQIAFKTHEPINQKIDNLKKILGEIENTLKDLGKPLPSLGGPNHVDFPVFSYSGYLTTPILSTDTAQNTSLKTRYANIDFWEIANLSHASSKRNTTFNTLIKRTHQLFNRFTAAGTSLLQNNQMDMHQYIPVLDDLQFDSATQKYTIAYVKKDGSGNPITLQTNSTAFAKMKRFLNKQNRVLNNSFHFDGHTFRLKFTHVLGNLLTNLDVLLNIRTLIDWINQEGKETESPLATTLKMQIYVAVAGAMYNLSTTTAIATMQSLLTLQNKLGAKAPFANFLRGKSMILGKIAMKASLLLGVIDIGLNIAAILQAETTAERTYFSVAYFFNAAAFSMSILSIIAFALGLGTLGIILVSFALGIAYFGHITTELIEESHADLKKMIHISNAYFANVLTGWKQAGFQLSENLLIPFKGAVFSHILLDTPGELIAQFYPDGVKMRKMDALNTPSFQENHPNAYLQLYAITDTNQIQNKIAITAAPILLPTDPKTTIEPIYSPIYPINTSDKAIAALEYFKQKDSKFLYAQNDSGLTEIRFTYSNTLTEIILGKGFYHFISPGIDKQLKIAHPDTIEKIEWTFNPWKENPYIYKYLQYDFKAPAQGKATVTIVLDRGQAGIKFFCDNKQVHWIIDARNFDGVSLIDQGSRLAFNHYVLQGASDYYEPGSWYETEKITSIHISNRRETNVTVLLPQGTIHLKDYTQPTEYLYCMQFLGIIPESELKQTVSLGIGKNHLVNHIRIENFAGLFSKRTSACFYQLGKSRFLYTENQGTNNPISNTAVQQCKNIQLLFANATHAWYRGDLSLFVAGSSSLYEDVFWVSNIQTKELEKVYMPLIFLENQRQGASTQILLPEIHPDKITFRQIFSYQEGNTIQQITTTYAILFEPSYQNTLFFVSIEGTLNLIKEAEKLGQENMWDLFLNRITTDQKNRFFDVWKALKSENLATCELIFNHRIKIGNKLIWPWTAVEYTVKETITASLPIDILNNPDFTVDFLSTFGEEATAKYYWIVKHRTGDFYKVYIQLANNQASPFLLNDFNIAEIDIQTVSKYDRQSLRIQTKNKYIYQYTANNELILQGIGNIAFFADKTDWWNQIIGYITAFEKQQNPYHLPAGQTKHIQIAPVISIDGLINKAGILFPIWYELSTQQIILSKIANNEISYSCLGISQDGQGSWIFDTVNQQLGYQPLVPKDDLPHIFTGWLLSAEDKIPDIIWLPASIIANTDTIIKVSLAENRNVNTITRHGYIFHISWNEHTVQQFVLTLLQIPLHLTDKYYDENTKSYQKEALAIALSGYEPYFSFPEASQLILKKGFFGWYHAASKQVLLFTHTAEEVAYFGFNTLENELYFIADNSLQKLSLRTKKVLTLEANNPYQRIGNLLILNLDNIEHKLKDFRTAERIYPHLDATSLQISCTEKQRADSLFTINTNYLFYTTTCIAHRGGGKLYLLTPLSSTDETFQMTRKNDDLMLSMRYRLFIIVNAFDPTLNTFHERLSIKFGNLLRSITVTKLVQQYLCASGKNEGRLIPNSPFGKSWSTAGNCLLQA